jgi:MraZ protein
LPDPQPKWLVGTAFNKLDPKGRVFLPVKMRSLLPGTLYLIKHPDRCLRLYTEEMYSTEVEEQQKILAGGRGDRDRMRVIGPPAIEVCVLDTQGRIVIPLQLRDHAGLQLEDTVVVTGMYSFVEFWSEEKFAAIQGAPAS